MLIWGKTDISFPSHRADLIGNERDWCRRIFSGKARKVKSCLCPVGPFLKTSAMKCELDCCSPPVFLSSASVWGQVPVSIPLTPPHTPTTTSKRREEQAAWRGTSPCEVVYRGKRRAGRGLCLKTEWQAVEAIKIEALSLPARALLTQAGAQDAAVHTHMQWYVCEHVWIHLQLQAGLPLYLYVFILQSSSPFTPSGINGWSDRKRPKHWQINCCLCYYDQWAVGSVTDKLQIHCFRKLRSTYYRIIYVVFFFSSEIKLWFCVQNQKHI